MPDKPTFKIAPAPRTPGAPASELTEAELAEIKQLDLEKAQHRKFEGLNDQIREINRQAEAGKRLCERFGMPENWAHGKDENYPEFRERCDEEARVRNFPPGPFRLSQLLVACQRHTAQSVTPAIVSSAESTKDAAPIAPEMTPEKRTRTRRTPHENPESFLKERTQVTKKEAATLLGVSERTIRHYIEAGDLKTQGPRYRNMVTKASILALIKSQKKPA